MSNRVWQAGNAGEAAEGLRAAHAEGLAVLPCGRRTRVGRHAPDASPDRWLSLAGMDRILHIDAADQTCEVEAGVSPAALDEALGEHGLELGVAAPSAAEGTLGGLFLAPDVSLLSAWHGPPRDQVLGAEWLLADGSRVASGARVVKSVAGYDVTRLFLGSRGRLAACLSLVLRLRPRPRDERWYRCTSESMASALAPGSARLAFQLEGDERAWLQTERVPLAQAGFEERPREEGQRAADQALAAFAAARCRLAVPPGETAGPAGAVRDLLGGQVAVSPSPEEQAKWRGTRGWALIPHGDASPWLAPLALACAPDATPFGLRPGAVKPAAAPR